MNRGNERAHARVRDGCEGARGRGRGDLRGGVPGRGMGDCGQGARDRRHGRRRGRQACGGHGADAIAGLVRRENGRRDARMLPAAVVVWAATLAGLRWPEHAMTGALAAGAAIMCVLAWVCVSVVRRRRRGLPGDPFGTIRMESGAEPRAAGGTRRGMARDGISGFDDADDAGTRAERTMRAHAALVLPVPTVRGQLALHGLVVMVAVLCALVSTVMHARMERSDLLVATVAGKMAEGGGGGAAIGTAQVAGTAATGTPSSVTLDATVTTPAVASERHGHDCRYDARAEAAAIGSEDGEAAARVAAPTDATVRVYASGEGCAVTRGGTYRLAGDLSPARYGAAPLWLEADGPAHGIREPPPWHRLATHMRARFHAVTERLDDQGRILVPGLTLGVLGSDAAVPMEAAGGDPDSSGDVPEPVDANIAKQVEERFRDAGIMHLMAVSGGHFMVVAALVRRLCGRFLAPRGVVAVAMAAAYAGLTALMQPSDSVLRAFAMGLLVVASGLGGRPAQTLSALCWTVIGVLLVEPSMASSYGFALSSAAVLGLVLHADRVEAGLRRHCPAPLASAMAMTIAAQMYTLPIQVLMEPRLALHAVLANVAVAPFVTFATLAGLAALAIAPVCAPLAFCCAWVASLGTMAMDTAARVVSGLPFAVLPWAQGVAGVALLVALEAAVALLLRARSRRGLRHGPAHARGGVTAGPVPVAPAAPPTPFERARVWWRDTWAMLG